jgi:nucleotide-binding universal stress UspA family protein
MSLGSKVLVATDLSEGADEAIRQGHERAQAAGGELVVCHVVPNALRYNPLFPQRNTPDAEGMVALERKVADATEARVVAVTGRASGSFRVLIDDGAPDAAIVRMADEVGSTLVVVASRGLTGLDRLLLGSVAERVVRYAHCPVLVARPRTKTGRVLVATDFSEAAAGAVAAAGEEASVLGAKVTLMHSVDVLPDPAFGLGAPFGASMVIPPKELLDEARQAAVKALEELRGRFHLDADVLSVEGNAASAILDAARDLPAEEIIVATRGRTGIARMVLGSVAERVVAHAPCPVLAVRRA